MFLQWTVFLSFIHFFNGNLLFSLTLLCGLYISKIVTIFYSIYCDVLYFLNQTFVSFCFKSNYSYVFSKSSSYHFLKAYPKECMLFHWNIYKIYSNFCIRYLTYLLVCLFLLFRIMFCCLFCVCLCLALWLVFWFLLSSTVIWNVDILFFYFTCDCC